MQRLFIFGCFLATNYHECKGMLQCFSFDHLNYWSA